MKFYKSIVTAGLALSLSGCFYQTVNQYDIQRAIKICKDVDNIAEISSRYDSTEYVTCMSGKHSLLSKVNEE